MKKITIFVTLIIAFVGLTVLSGCGRNSYHSTKLAGPYTVDLQIDHNPPVAGSNNVTVNIKDPANKDVSDAKVVVDYDMPAMPGMPAMSHKADATLQGNAYKARIDLMMSGSWTVSVNIDRAGQTQSAKFSIDAR
jgi:hypothetical protein